MEASVATPSQGAPPAQSQPPASGQGGGGQESTAGQGSGFNWGLFPNVPESQRELLQPHLTNVLGHVTKMEQQYAPYKGLIDAVQPNDVQNLLSFLQNYNSDPLSTVTGIVGALHENGQIQNPQFSLEALQSLLQGSPGGGPAPTAPAEDIPTWAQELRQQVSMLAQGESQRQQEAQQQAMQAQEAENARVLAEGHTLIREGLKAAGLPEAKKDGSPIVPDEALTAALIVSQGDIQGAIAQFTGLRDGFLGDFAAQNGSGQRPPTIAGQTPEAPKGGLRPKSGDSFRKASQNAEQTLRMRNAAAAQE